MCGIQACEFMYTQLTIHTTKHMQDTYPTSAYIHVYMRPSCCLFSCRQDPRARVGQAEVGRVRWGRLPSRPDRPALLLEFSGRSSWRRERQSDILRKPGVVGRAEVLRWLLCCDKVVSYGCRSSCMWYVGFTKPYARVNRHSRSPTGAHQHMQTHI